MKRLFKYLKPYMLPTLLAPLFMLLEVAMDLMQPALMSYVIDVGVANSDKAYIVRTCILMFVCALLGVIGGLGNMYFSTRAGYGFARDLRSDLYRRIQSFSFSDIDRFKTGSLVTRTTNDVTQIQNAFTTCIRMLVRAPFLCIGGVVMVLMLNAKLSLVVLAAIPFLASMIVFLLKRGRPLFTSMQEKLDRVNTVMQENLSGIRVVKAFARAEHEKEKFKVANDDLCNSTMRAMMMMSMAFPLINLIMNATMILMYAVGGHMVFRGDLTPGEIMAFSNYIMQILMSLTTSSFMLMFLSRAGVSIRRVLEVLNTQSDIVDGPDATAEVTRGEVEFDHVSFAYPGQSGNVLSDISFTARAGETVAILGSTGSGKSTLISLIPRLYDASEGSVKIDGKDVRAYQLNTLRGAIGVALQESVLFTGTIEENLRWGDADADMEEITSAARHAQADGFIRSFAKGYDSDIEQGGSNVSGGQKQRLCIARALLRKPKILILDDSTSAVDTATEAQIRSAFAGELKDSTKIIIAQRITSVMDADRIIVIDEGKITGIGTHDELMLNNQEYREIYESQMSGSTKTGKEGA